MDPVISILRNGSLLGAAQIVSSLIAMALMVVVSRTLGDVEFGRLYLALTLSAIIGIVVDLGLSQVVTRVVAREPALTAPYLRRAALVVGILGALLYVVLLGVAQALGYTAEVRFLVAVLGLLMVAEGFATLLSAVYQGHERMLVPAVARVIGNAVMLALVVPLLSRGYGAAMVAAMMVLASCLRLALTGVTLRRLGGFRQRPPSPPSWPDLLRAGLPFLAAQGLGIFVIRVDVVILGQIAGEARVGWYGAASRVVEALNFIPIVLTTATFPVASRLWVTSPAQFQATVRKTLHVLLVITVPVAVTLFALADQIVGFLFTLASYASAIPILRIQAVSLGLMYVDYLVVCILMAIGRERRWIAFVAAACFLNPAINWLLIPATEASFGNGAIGAALGKLVTEVLFMVCTLRALPVGIFGAESWRVAARAAALGVALGAFLLGSRAIGAPWVLAGALGGTGYLAAAVWCRLLPPDVTTWVVGSLLRRPIAAPDLTPELDGVLAGHEGSRSADAA